VNFLSVSVKITIISDVEYCLFKLVFSSALRFSTILATFMTDVYLNEGVAVTQTNVFVYQLITCFGLDNQLSDDS
jgi:hypothetical protein